MIFSVTVCSASFVRQNVTCGGLGTENVQALNSFSESIMSIIQKVEPPPEGLSAADLGQTLLYHMEVGRNQANMVAACEALRIKSSQKNWTVAKAYIHIAQRWTEYKQSEHYRSKFRRGAAGFLSEGDYDNPGLWGGNISPSKESNSGLDPMVAEMRRLKRDRELNPQNYVSLSELASLDKSMDKLKAKKRMPFKKSDILPMIINPDLNRTKLENQAQLLKQRDANNNTVGTVGSRDSFTEEKQRP